MPWKTASLIKTNEKQERILTEMSKGTHQPHHMRIRSQIILQASHGLSNNKIKENMKISYKKVKRWRDRYSLQQEELERIEAETPQKLRGRIEKILTDEQRPGTPATFADEQVAAILALACEAPSKFDLPFSHWTPNLLRNEAIKLGIVDEISERQVGRFLKRKRFTTAPEPMLAES